MILIFYFYIIKYVRVDNDFVYKLRFKKYYITNRLYV